jgi:predicted PurR-regulated permease PerM
MFSEENPKRLAQVALVALLIVGCIAVLRPVLGAVLFAFVLWICTWPLYAKQLLPRLGGNNNLGATLMTSLLVLVMLLPMVFLATSIASGTDALIDEVQPYFSKGIPPRPPAIVRSIPLLGNEIDRSWRRIASNQTEQNAFLQQLIEPARKIAISIGSIVATGLLQIALVVFVAFFLYRDGAAIRKALQVGAHKLGGDLGDEMIHLTQHTVLGVMLGIVGTAVAQAAVAMLGFLIAGVPGAVLLGFGTFFLSMIPIGPPILWGAAAAWLYSQDETGWAIFLVLYGTFVISSIDNFLKPILMARGSGVSVLLIALGVIGGIIVFGFIGIFLGPVLLALGHMLVTRWTREETTA